MLTCTAENDFLIFHAPGKGSAWKQLASIPLQDFMSGDLDNSEIPETLRKRNKLSLLIVPDYWMGTSLYQLQSRKKSIIDVFISRKLQSEFPTIPEIHNFFTYSFFQDELGKNCIHTSFLQEPAAFTLFDRLTKIGLSPYRITSGALLWEQKLGKTAPDFNTVGTALLHFNTNGCLQYYFDSGRFLFSRFTEFQVQTPDGERDYNEIIYEVTQSMHLYAQKTKSDISTFYLASSEEEKAPPVELISEHLEKDTVNLCEESSLSSFSKDLTCLSECEATLSLIRKGKIAGIAGLSHRMRQRDLEWRPAQRTGIFIGLLFVIILGTELFQLRQMDAAARSSLPGAGEKTIELRNALLLKFNGDLDTVIEQRDWPNPTLLTKRISASIPKSAWLREVHINMEDPAGVTISSTFDAKDIDELSSNLVRFLEDLHASIPGSGDVTLNDLKIARPETAISSASVQSRFRGYDIEMEFGIK